MTYLFIYVFAFIQTIMSRAEIKKEKQRFSTRDYVQSNSILALEMQMCILLLIKHVVCTGNAIFRVYKRVAFVLITTRQQEGFLKRIKSLATSLMLSQQL